MALHINRGEKPVSGGLVADRRLYLTADKSRVVEEGDPASAFLLASAGRKILDADVERLGLRLADGRIVWGASAPEPKPEPEPEPAEVVDDAPRRRKGRP